MDSRHARPSLANLAQTMVVLAWVIVFWGLLLRLGGVPLAAKFLSPNYWWLIDMGIAVLGLFLLSLVYCDPPHTSRGGLSLLLHTGVMIVPLLYLPIAMGSQLSAEASIIPVVSLVPLDGSSEEGVPDAVLDTADPKEKERRPTHDVGGTPPEPVSLLDLSLAGEAYLEKRIETLGIVYRDERLPRRTFLCYRLLMLCCAADARPVAVLVRYGKTSGLKTGDWVSVEGVVGQAKVKGRVVRQISADRVAIAQEPKVPYLFQ